MSVAKLPAGAVLVTGEALDVVAYAVRLARQHRARNGLPPLRALDALADAVAPVAELGHADSDTVAPAEDDVMTTTHAAELLQVSERTARRLAPQLGGRKAGGTWLLDAAAVAEHLAGGATS